MNTLEFFKMDIGVTHNKRDAYFQGLIESAKKGLEEKGIELDENLVEDQFLISDYAAWQYRNRDNNTDIPNILILRIRNRIVKARAGNV